MKTKRVRLTWEFDIPIDEDNLVTKQMGDLEFAKMVVEQNVTLYAFQCHLRDSTKWLSTDYGIYKLHDNWSDILEKGNWELTFT